VNLSAAVDHPGVPFARAADALGLAETISNPNLQLNLDHCHAVFRVIWRRVIVRSSRLE
jgi:hydroxypyruvate isomerase